MRRAAATIVLLLALGLVPAAGASPDSDRAHASIAALDAVWQLPAGLYADPGRDTAATAWPFSQAVAAAIAVAATADATPADRRRAATSVRALARYRTRGVYASGPGGEVYVDDNLWIAFDLLDWRRLARSQAPVATGLRLLGFAVAHWDLAPADPCSGGVYWTARGPNRDRNAVTTAGTALLAMRLAPLAPDRRAALWWSRRMLDWLDRCLLESNGLYADHIDAAGRVEPREWSYNQGLVIGALALAGAAGDAAALRRAEQVADGSLWFLDPGRLWAEPPEFAAVLARNLLLLGSVDGDPRWRRAVEAYADASWTQARDPLTGLFDLDGTGPKLIEQAALTQIYALLGAGVTAGP